MTKNNKNILVTGCAGFIGFHTCLALLKNKHFNVFGIDNLNNYYDKQLKLDRLKILKNDKSFVFNKINISNKKKVDENFKKNKYDYVVHLAAQAGVRYSIESPETYVKSNQIGFFNILDSSRLISVKHFLYASSSSVYGTSIKTKQSEDDNTDSPISFYAATKKSNELMAYSYSNIFKLATTGLRFFTVYGPYGRPDMSPHKFVSAIKNNETIYLNNYGKHKRDFTYIDDVVISITRLLDKTPKNKIPQQIINVGCNSPKKISEFIKIIESLLNKKAKIKLRPLQPGDVKDTHANINKLNEIILNRKKISLEQGMKKFIDWFNEYYK